MATVADQWNMILMTQKSPEMFNLVIEVDEENATKF
jgi:hypothetical protein